MDNTNKKIILRLPNKDFAFAPNKNLRSLIRINKNELPLNDSLNNINLNASDLSDSDRQKSNNFIFYGNINQVIDTFEGKPLIPLKKDELLLINDSNINWNLRLMIPKNLINFDYTYRGRILNTIDGIPYNSFVNITNNTRVFTCSCKHNLQEGQYINILGKLYQVNFLGGTNKYNSKEFEFVIPNDNAIPLVGQFKRVIDPNNIEESTSQYGVYIMDEIIPNALAEMTKTSYAKNIYLNPILSYRFNNIFNIEDTVLDPFGLPITKTNLHYQIKLESNIRTVNYDWVSNQGLTLGTGFFIAEGHTFNIGDTISIITTEGASYNGTYTVNSIGDSNGNLLNQMIGLKDQNNNVVQVLVNSLNQTLFSKGQINYNFIYNTYFGFNWDIPYGEDLPGDPVFNSDSILNTMSISGITGFIGDYVEFNKYDLKVTILSKSYNFIRKNTQSETEFVVYQTNENIKIKDFSDDIEEGNIQTDIIPEYSKYFIIDNTYKYRDILDYGFISTSENGEVIGVNSPFNNGTHMIYNNLSFFVFGSSIYEQNNNQSLYINYSKGDVKC